MKQAIGRAQRYGQTKHVHVYHFIVAKTIDVDIFERRNGKVLKRVDRSKLDPTVVLPAIDNFTRSNVMLRDRGESDFASLAAEDIFAQGSEYA
jgi:superfamily II DNA or RNA helicase